MNELGPAPQPSGERLRPPADSFRVLLVEDNPGDALLIQEAVSEGGAVRLERVDRLAKALDRLAGEPFDAVLLDLDLPDSHGFDTIAAILAHTRVPILVMTGLDDESIGLQAIRHGAQDYLVKGRVTDEVLRRSLRYAIERWRLQAAVSTPLIETAPVGLAVLDCGLRFLYVNPALASLDGLPAVAHLGQRIDRVVPELGVETVELLERVVATGQTVRDVEVQGHADSGAESATWLLGAVPLRDAAADTVGVTVTVVEITERKRREQALEALAELRRQAQAIGESIPFGIWVAEPGGRMKYLSDSFLELLGMTMARPATSAGGPPSLPRRRPRRCATGTNRSSPAGRGTTSTSSTARTVAATTSSHVATPCATNPPRSAAGRGSTSTSPIAARRTPSATPSSASCPTSFARRSPRSTPRAPCSAAPVWTTTGGPSWSPT